MLPNPGVPLNWEEGGGGFNSNLLSWKYLSFENAVEEAGEESDIVELADRGRGGCPILGFENSTTDE